LLLYKFLRIVLLLLRLFHLMEPMNRYTVQLRLKEQLLRFLYKHRYIKRSPAIVSRSWQAVV
jgi:hypothetical protein